MKIFAISFIFTTIAILFQAGINILQTRQISELTARISCLERDRIYVGFTFCVPKDKDLQEK